RGLRETPPVPWDLPAVMVLDSRYPPVVSSRRIAVPSWPLNSDRSGLPAPPIVQRPRNGPSSSILPDAVLLLGPFPLKDRESFLILCRAATASNQPLWRRRVDSGFHGPSRVPSR